MPITRVLRRAGLDAAERARMAGGENYTETVWARCYPKRHGADLNGFISMQLAMKQLCAGLQFLIRNIDLMITNYP